MSYTKEFIFTVPEGKALYRSVNIDNKVEELKASGDLISVSVVDISSTQKKIIMIWKDITAFNSWQNWKDTSGETSNNLNHMSTNNISLS
jgi:hypothetical protein